MTCAPLTNWFPVGGRIPRTPRGRVCAVLPVSLARRCTEVEAHMLYRHGWCGVAASLERAFRLRNSGGHELCHPNPAPKRVHDDRLDALTYALSHVLPEGGW